MSMQLGTVSALEVQLAAMLAGLPDLDALEQELAAAPAAGARAAAGLPARSIELADVRFSYDDGPEVLGGIDLTLEAGRSLALVGLNGAGKTTLVALLSRLYEPTGGAVLVDGTPLSEFDARAWQRQVAVVGQEALWLPLSAAENVGLREDADRAALDRAAARAGASELIARLPRGWDTVLSARYEGGVDLSGGEWQRLVLARALFAVEHGARVLVLDEPTAQLDVRAEAAFYERFLGLVAGTTSVVISHRFSTVRRADRIAVLSDGVISELGSHDELMAAGGEYARMFTLQAEAFGR
jgi:ATP-binding cassette subfamily B protein